MKNVLFNIFGGAKVLDHKNRRHGSLIAGLVLVVALMSSSVAWAQGSIFGTVSNADLSTPANGEISFFGYLDDTDEEIRLEICVGSGYDAGNWFDDFQNYLTEAPGNPYDYHFYNSVNSEGFKLSDLIPNNSFQQEDIQLASVGWPTMPTGLVGEAISSSSVLLSWTGSAGSTYHVYRRASTSKGSFFRIDDASGSLANPGVSTTYFVDTGVDGISDYDYVVIAEDAGGNLSPHSAVITVSSAGVGTPVVNSIVPAAGYEGGGTAITINGSGFDPAGATATIGGAAVTSLVVVSPYEITGVTPAGTAGAADVVVTNTASGNASAPLVGGFTYQGNVAPVLATIGTQTVAEGANLNFNVSATDSDLDSLIFTANGVPTNATFTDNYDGSGTFDFNPDFLQAGSYFVSFLVTDGIDVDSEVVQIDVTEAGNQVPVLAAIGSQGVTEGANLNFNVSANDADLDSLIFSANGVPTNATFTDNFDGTATFDFNPDFTQAGIYNVSFLVSDGVDVDSEVVEITVAEFGNHAPELATIGGQSVTEAQNLNFNVSGSDIDADSLIFSANGVPTNATFVDNFDGTGTFDFNPDYTQAGSYFVSFIVSDGVEVDSEVVQIDVAEFGNNAPTLAAIGAQSVAEGDNLNFGISGTDPDGDSLIYSANNVPTNATFVDNFDGTGTFDFNPDYTQSGTYNVTFIISDGVEVDSEVVQIDVTEFGNHAPELAAIGSQTVAEGGNLSFGLSATDIDLDSLIFSANGVPTNATLTDNYDGTATFDFNPDFVQAGTYNVSFLVFDGVDVDSEVVQIDVTEAGNQLPVLATIGSQVVSEGGNLNFNVSATDPDLDSLIFSANGVPTNATFTDNYDGTGTFDFNPDFLQNGTYFVSFLVSDGVEVDSEVVQIDVTEAGNQAPTLAAIGSQNVAEGANLSFGVSATDADLDSVILYVNGLPANATFVDNFDGTGTFDFNPDFAQAGTHMVTFVASDGVDADSEVVQIDVSDAGNQAPVLATIGPRTVSELDNLNFIISAADPDLDSVILTAVNLPLTATFTDNFDGTGTFDLTPGLGTAGNYPVTFIASDGVEADSEVVVVQVIEFENQAPLIDPIDADTVKEGQTLTLLVHAVDDADVPSFIVSTSLESYVFTDSGNGYATFVYTPDYYSAGEANVRFYASDNYTPPLTSYIDVPIVTLDSNRPPLIHAPDTVYVGGTEDLSVRIFATDSTDADGGPLYLFAPSKPAGSTFVDSGSGIAGFEWTPPMADTGVHFVALLCLDDNAPAMQDRDTVFIVVQPINQPPILDPIGTHAVMEGDTLELSITASDPDGTIPSLNVVNIPRRAVFVDNGDGTGLFTFAPDFQQAGLVQPQFIASDGSKIDQENVLIQVTDVPQAPVLSLPTEPLEVLEGDTLVFLITATDGDSTIPFIEIDTTSISLISTFVDSANGVASFEFTPLFIHAGPWDITFFAYDETERGDTAIATITVLDAGNQLPLITSPVEAAVIQTTELQDLVFTVNATDADSVPPLLSVFGLPSGADFVDNNDYTGTFSWFDIPNLSAGTYPLTFYANDADNPADVDSVQITIEVANYNYPPDLIFFVPFTVCIGDDCSMDIDEGDTTEFKLYSGDLDGTPPIMAGWRYSIEVDSVFDTLVFTPPVEVDTNIVNDTTYLPLPDNMVVTDLGNDTADFIFSPDYTQSGTYRVFLMALDASDTTIYKVTHFTFNVHNVPMTPILEPIGNQTMTEGDTLDLDIHGYDPDGNSVTIFAQGLPPGAQFTIVQPNTAYNRFYYNPGYSDAGVYNVLFYVRENSFPFDADSEFVEITVNDAGPQAPIISITPSGTQTMSLSDSLKVWVRSYDPDGAAPTLSIVGDPEVPYTSVFVDSANGNGSFRFGPLTMHADSSWTVRFIASDGVLADTVAMQIDVISYIHGDADGDGLVNISDAIYIIAYIFVEGSEPVPYLAGDADGDGIVNISDVSYLIQWIFNGGPPPVE